MRIGVFHLGFVYSGGGEKLILTQSEELRKLGHQVDIYSPIVKKNHCFPDLTMSIPIRQMLPSFRFLPEWESMQVIITCLLAPFIAYRFRNYDIIFAANQPSPWIAYWVKTLYGVPYVSYLAQPTRFIYPRKIDKEEGLIFARTYPFSIVTSLLRLSRPLTKWIDAFSIQQSATILANGTYIKRLIDRFYGVSSYNIPAPTVIEPSTYRSRNKRITGSINYGQKTVRKPYILVTNRHFPQKRFEYALFALQSLLADTNDISLIITGGETSYTAYLKELSEELSLESHIHFTGLVDEKTLKRLYAHAYMYLYTAPEEDYGMGIYEAMASGAPVVAWNQAGPRYLISDRNTGLKAQPLDVTEYLSCVHELMHDVSLYESLQQNAFVIALSHQVKHHVSRIEKQLFDARKI